MYINKSRPSRSVFVRWSHRFFQEVVMTKNCSFAGALANRNVVKPRKPATNRIDQPALEDPAVFGGNTTALPSGTVVEFPEEGGYRVVKKPD